MRWSLSEVLTCSPPLCVAAMSSYLYIVKSELPLVIQAFLKADPNSEWVLSLECLWPRLCRAWQASDVQWSATVSVSAYKQTTCSWYWSLVRCVCMCVKAFIVFALFSSWFSENKVPPIQALDVSRHLATLSAPSECDAFIQKSRSVGSEAPVLPQMASVIGAKHKYGLLPLIQKWQ